MIYTLYSPLIKMNRKLKFHYDLFLVSIENFNSFEAYICVWGPLGCMQCYKEG